MCFVMFVSYRAGAISKAQVVRLLKLLRYFESLRLLVDAAANSVEALPVLFYTLALGCGFSSLCCHTK